MASGDGWLVRLRTSARALQSAELRALVELASAYGNGIIELTRRANLQLRGLQLERIPELRAQLIALGLVDASQQREARPALLIDPVAALDPQSGVVGLGRALDEALLQSVANGAEGQSATSVSQTSSTANGVHGQSASSVAGQSVSSVAHARGADSCERAQSTAGDVWAPVAANQLVARGLLSPKLGVVLDAGSGSAVGVDADIRFVVADSRLGVFVGARTPQYLGACELARAPAVLAALLAELTGFAVEAAADSGAPRMRDLLAVHGIGGLRAAVAEMLNPDTQSAARSMLADDEAPAARAALGFCDADGGGWFGLAVPFGSGACEQWLAIADLAERFGDGAVRFTPAREVLLSGVGAERAHALEAAARALGLIVDPRDLRLRLVACSGAPACSSAFGETRALASTLGVQASQLLAAGATLHVSGCKKGCASRTKTELNVVLAASGAHFALDADITAASAAPVESLATISARLGSLAANVERRDSRSV